MNLLGMIETIIVWYFNHIIHPWLVSIVAIAIFAIIIVIVTTIKDEEEARTHYLLVLAFVAVWPITLPIIAINIMLGAWKSRI